jgi:hypothetical protein
MALVSKESKGKPSPAAYKPISNTLDGRKPSLHAKFATIDVHKKNSFPGVGTYDTKDMPNLNQKRSEYRSFGKGKRTDRMKDELRETMCKPGPGGYDGTSFTHKKSSPKCSFGRAA